MNPDIHTVDNADWLKTTANILFSMALIRVARPHVKTLILQYGWAAIVLLVGVLFAMLPCFLWSLPVRSRSEPHPATAVYGPGAALYR